MEFSESNPKSHGAESWGNDKSRLCRPTRPAPVPTDSACGRTRDPLPPKKQPAARPFPVERPCEAMTKPENPGELLFRRPLTEGNQGKATSPASRLRRCAGSSWLERLALPTPHRKIPLPLRPQARPHRQSPRPQSQSPLPRCWETAGRNSMNRPPWRGHPSCPQPPNPCRSRPTGQAPSPFIPRIDIPNKTSRFHKKQIHRRPRSQLPLRLHRKRRNLKPRAHFPA